MSVKLSFLCILPLIIAASLCSASERRWIDGTAMLLEQASRVARASDEGMLAPALLQPPQIGEQRRFCAVNYFKSISAYFTTATCRAVGDYCYIFVEDSQWDKRKVTGTGVAKLKRAFDDATPGDSTKGIYEILTDSIGQPPDDIDLDPRIYILILDIPDGYNGSNNFVAGYFQPLNQNQGNQRDPGTGMQFSSNEVEMIYIDSDPLNTDDILSREILAHEFQHLIHWRSDPNEDIWINEGCSDYAALTLCGYGNGRRSWHLDAFERAPQTSLVYWPYGMVSPLANYGAAYLWIVYLHEHYGGAQTISSLINEPANGINGINTVLLAQGYTERFENVFSDWKIANFLDNTSFASGKYGYKNLDVKIRSMDRLSFPVINEFRSIQSWATDYIVLTDGDKVSNLNIDFRAKNIFDVRIIMLKNGSPTDIASLYNGNFSMPEFGYDADTAILAINWQPRTEAEYGDMTSYSLSARLGGETGFKVSILPNSVNSRYIDLIVKIENGIAGNVPKIKFARSGKTIINEQNMTLLARNIKKTEIYTYQLYIPSNWDPRDISWNIYYLGHSAASGNIMNSGALK